MATPQFPFIKDITGDLFETEILSQYLEMRQKCTKNICELTYLPDFPQTDAKNNPRRIIKRMLDKYIEMTNLINKYPLILMEFKFKYCTEDARVYQITLSNNMQFRNDILMICYIQHLLFTPKYLNKKSNVIGAMVFLMAIKYDINIDTTDYDSKSLTFINISVSYLSIYLDILYNNFSNFSDISDRFPDFNLPVMIYAPLVISILPRLSDPPIAIFIVIALALYETCLPSTVPNISLVALYKRILSLYNTTIPEEMKLHLCRKYNIVVSEGNKFKFAPCFAKYRQKAKDIISKKKPNDPDLKDILSII